jgi:hypothetical protein
MLIPPSGGAFTLLWPTKSISYGVEVTRDYIEGISDGLKRRALIKAFGDTKIPAQLETNVIPPVKDTTWFKAWTDIMGRVRTGKI